MSIFRYADVNLLNLVLFQQILMMRNIQFFHVKISCTFFWMSNKVGEAYSTASGMRLYLGWPLESFQRKSLSRKISVAHNTIFNRLWAQYASIAPVYLW